MPKTTPQKTSPKTDALRKLREAKATVEESGAPKKAPPPAKKTTKRARVEK